MKLLRTIPQREDLSPALLEALRKVEECLQKPILAAYVSGSFANGYQIPTSDIDLHLVFEQDLNDADFDQLEELLSLFQDSSPEIDITFRSLPQLLKRGEVEMGRSFLHIYGSPVHQQVQNPPLHEYIYQSMHNAYLRMAHTRRDTPYVWPLAYPNAEDPFKGYAWRKLKHNNQEQASIKEIVVLTGWMATAVTAWIGKTYVPSKEQVPKMFSQFVGGQIALDFEEVTSVCRNRFHYLVPTNPKDCQIIYDLLPKVLGIENFFIQHYHEFLLANLHDSDPVKARTNSTRLADIVCHAPRLSRQ